MIPDPGAYGYRPPEPPRPTSMCLEINDWTHEDCPADFCGCECHHPTEETP